MVALAEIPRESRNKFEYDQELDAIVLDRRLFTSTVYPADYGFVEGTLAEDGDPLDALVLVGDATVLPPLGLLPAVGLATSGSTDAAKFCLQLNGGPFSGDLGFFRFMGARPTSAGNIKTLAGRAAGLSPAFGTATVAKDGSFSEFGVTFFIDATEGQFDVSFFPPSATSGSGYGDYGEYDVNQSVTANVVNCNLEP